MIDATVAHERGRVRAARVAAEAQADAGSERRSLARPAVTESGAARENLVYVETKLTQRVPLGLALRALIERHEGATRAVATGELVRWTGDRAARWVLVVQLIEAREHGLCAPGHVFDADSSPLACENSRDLHTLARELGKARSFAGKALNFDVYTISLAHEPRGLREVERIASTACAI
jgi:hypothetical protein